MSTAVPTAAADAMADDSDAHRRQHRPTAPPPDGAPHTADTPEADRAEQLAKPWEVHNWLIMDAEPMEDCGWLVRGLWPADAYGVMAAESKAGKTWLALDLAVSVVCGVPFLDQFETDEPGPVLYYSGEGGDRNIRRRLRAILDSKSIAYDDPRLSGLHIVTRPPRLAEAAHIKEMKTNARAVRPLLVVLDPLYLSLGANLASLNEVGAELGQLQQVSEEVGAAMVVVHHWNKTGTGKGAARMSGAGPEQWGRVLLSAAVDSKDTDSDHEQSSVVTLDVEVSGGELADLSFSVRRTVWSDDPDDLSSPMHYDVTASPLGAPSAGGDGARIEGHAVRSAPGRCLAILRAEPGRWFTVDEMQARTADEAAEGPSVRPLKRDTVGSALRTLHGPGLIDRQGSAGGAGGGGHSYRAKATDAAN